MSLELAQENVWFDKWRYDDAEANFHAQKTNHESEELSDTEEVHAAAALSTDSDQQSIQATAAPLLGSLANQIARAREDIQNSRAASGCTSRPAAVRPVAGGRCAASAVAAPADVLNRVTKLEGENTSLRGIVRDLEDGVKDLTRRLADLECCCRSGTVTAAATAPAAAATKPAPAQTEEEDDDDDDVDLFGSDEDEEEECAEAARVREERLKAYAEKKSKKAGPIAKSSVLLDVKPYGDETDMVALEADVRKIAMDGLIWAAAKLVSVAYGVEKLSILCIVEDEKVSIEELSEQIEELDDVQSVDISAFNKI